MKGKISKNLKAILGNEAARQKLRRALLTGNDSVIEVDGSKYRVVMRGGFDAVAERNENQTVGAMTTGAIEIDD